MTRNLSRLGLTALALIAGQIVFAQDATTGAVFGTVKNNKGMALSAAKVILDGGRGQMEYATDVSGQFRITGLIPGKYTITVVAAGYEKMLKQTINVGVNQRTPINVVLTAAAAATVEVVASASQLDATTVTTGAQFSTDTFSALPLGRSFTAVASMAPGVVSSGIDSGNPSIGGGSGLENQYVIDGANTTNAGYGSSGSYSGTYGSLGSGINTDFIQEVQVKSFAMEAEYGQTTGGIVNAITKSGTNTFEGTAFTYFDIDALNARDKVPALVDTVRPTFDSSNRAELGFFFSGPIIKDKLFFFVGYNPIQEVTKRTAPLEASEIMAGRQFEQKKVTNAYYAKVQWQLNTSHLIEFSTFGDPGERKYGPQVAGDYLLSENKFSKLKFGSDTFSLKYNGIFFNDFLVEARVSQVKNNFSRQISEAGNADWNVLDTGAGGVSISPNAAGLYEAKADGENTQMEFKLTKTFGPVEFRGGYLHEDVIFDASNAMRSGPIGFVDPHSGVPFTTGLLIQKRYYVTTPGTPGENTANAIPYYRIIRGLSSSPARHTKTSYDAIFLQGSAQIGNFNVKAGVRMEQQELKGTDITYKFKGSDNISPRLGVTWDIEGNGKSKLYAFIGRYYEKVPLDIAVRALSTEQGVNRSDFYTLSGFTNLSNPIMDDVNINDVNMGTGAHRGEITVYGPANPDTAYQRHFVTTGSDPTVILPNTKCMYQDERVLGYDTETSSGMTFSNRMIWRNVGRVLEDLSLDGDSYFIGNPGENEGEIRKLPGMEDIGAATFPAPVRKYWAFEIEARKATSKYSTFLNVRFSKLEGNYEGLFRGDNGQDDPNISSLYDLPVEMMRDDNRGLTGREQFLVGSLPSDRTVVANFGFSYGLDMGLSLGVLCRAQTGTPITTYLAHSVYENAGEIPQYGRGSEGRTPTTYNFDTTATYTMKLRGKMSLAFRADIFNFFNTQKPISYDSNYDVGLGSDNPNYMRVNQYDTGRRVRLGVKFNF